MQEESPSSTEQGRQLTAGGGDFKESATEINRQHCVGKDGKVRQERTALLVTMGAHVNPARSKVKNGNGLFARHLTTPLERIGDIAPR